MFVGSTILAIGTDLPELVLSIQAGIQRSGSVETSGPVIGNAIGSSLGQIGFALGVAGLLGFVTSGRRPAWNEVVMLLGSIALFFLLSVDGVFTRIDGGVLITTYRIYFATAIRRDQYENSDHKPGTPVPGSGIGTPRLLGLLNAASPSHLAITSAAE